VHIIGAGLGVAFATTPHTHQLAQLVREVQPPMAPQPPPFGAS